jgi:hypothetical protein
MTLEQAIEYALSNDASGGKRRNGMHCPPGTK